MLANGTRNIVRTTRLALVGAASAVALTGAFTGTAAAFTPAPQPNLPMAQAPQQPQPPIGPMILTLPEDPGPVVDGPDQIAQPVPVPDPHPAPHPQGPDDLAIPEDDGPGFEGPGDFTNGEDDGGGFDGPGDLTIGEPTPDPQPQPQPESGTGTEVLDETEQALSSNGAPSELAFTGGDLDLLTAGVALLGAGGLAAVGGTLARRRQRARA